MAEKGHAPTAGKAKRWWDLGAGLCPDCKVDLDAVNGQGGEEFTCPDCGEGYSIPGGVSA